LRALLRRRTPAVVVPTTPSVKQAQHALWHHGDPLGVEPDDRWKTMWDTYKAYPRPARELMAIRHPGFAAAFELSFEYPGIEKLRTLVKRAQLVVDGVDEDGYVRAVYR
jgi:hypothetical protein